MIGGLFIGHGTQKLFGWFGGNGPEQTGGFFEKLGLRPGKRHALAAGAAETAGGAMLAVGLLTPFATATLSSVMITAIRKVHGKNGVWNSSGGFEYNAVLLAAFFVLAEQGPGSYSIDARAFPRLHGPALAVAQLACAAAASELAQSDLINQPVSEPEPGPGDITGDGTPTADLVSIAA
jgi:putative oxidoreductase